MSDADTLEQVKTGLKTASEMSGKVQEWAKEADEVAEAGKDLSSIQGFLKGTTAFGEVSAAFAVAGAGLELATMIMGVKSPEEQMMEMITALSNKVDRLSAHIDHKFSAARAHGDLINARRYALDHTDQINDLKTNIENWHNAKTPADKDSAREVLLQDDHTPDLYRAHVEDLARRLQSQNADENLLLAISVDTFGAMGQVSAAGAAILSSALYAAMAYGVLNALRHQDDPGKNSLMTPQGVADLFDVHIGTIADAISKASQACIDNTDANIDACLAETLDSLDVSDLEVATGTLGSKLFRTYYWKSWVVVVYEPVTGWGVHSPTGGQNRREFFRHHCLHDQKANIFVSWCRPLDALPKPGEPEFVTDLLTNHAADGQSLVDDVRDLIPPTFPDMGEFRGLPPDTRAFLDAFDKYRAPEPSSWTPSFPSDSLLFLVERGIEWHWAVKSDVEYRVFDDFPNNGFPHPYEALYVPQ